MAVFIRWCVTLSAASAVMAAAVELPMYSRIAGQSDDATRANEEEDDVIAILPEDDSEQRWGDVTSADLERDWDDPAGPLTARFMTPWEAHVRRLQAPCSSQTVSNGWWNGSRPADPANITGW